MSNVIEETSRIDFHTTTAPTGAVGITAYDGIIILKRIEVSTSR